MTPPTARARASRPRAPRRRAVGWVVLAILIVGATELLALACYRVLFHESYDRQRVYARQRACSTAAARSVPLRPGASNIEVVHPYLGFVHDADVTTSTDLHVYGFPVSSFGFRDDKSPVQPGGPDRYVIGIFGGSFAQQLSVRGAEALLEELRGAPELAGKELVLVRVALNGYKQPQQFLTLAYLLACGAHFDAVINVDGFNEVALPVVELLPKQVAPWYPRKWWLRAQALPAPESQLLLSHLWQLIERRRCWARAWLCTPLRYSVTTHLLWQVMDQAWQQAMLQDQDALLRRPSARQAFVAAGPPYHAGDPAQLYTDLAEIWARGSWQMHRLCQANGIAYFHCLQPNQYVAGSKPMGPDERRTSWRVDHPYRAPVEQGYPRLQAAGATLVRQGVAFDDLTLALADHPEPLYADDCCHLNDRGYALIGARIGRALRERLRAGAAAQVGR